MIGLRVTAVMAEPYMAGVDGLHLDGILAYGAYLSLSRDERDKLPPMDSDSVVDLDLPLGRWCAKIDDDDVHQDLLDNQGRVWGWLASREMGRSIRGKHEVRKRPAIDEMISTSKDASYNMGSGAMKAANLSVAAKFARVLQWVCVGDKAEVERLLSRVRGIGKKASVGMGRVVSWSVAEDREVTDEMVKSLRRMPSVDGVVVRGVRPPYHHHSRQALCL